MKLHPLPTIPLNFNLGFIAAFFASSFSNFAYSQADDAELRMEVVQVTALRRATTVEDTGMSVSAVGGQELQERAALNFQDFMRTLPGVNFAEGAAPGEQSIIIRGINFPSNRFQLPTVAVYLDEINLSQTGRNPDIDLIDMNRVEVLRGPQGTLYGGSSMGGTVRYISNKVDLEMQEGWVQAGLEQISEGGLGNKVAFMYNQPLSDTFGVRLVGYRRDLSGWIDNVGFIHTGDYSLIDDSIAKDDINDELTWGGRVALRWQPTSQFNIDLMYLIHDAQVGGLSNWNPNLIDAGYGEFKAAVRDQESYSDDNEVMNLTISYDADWGSATWITSRTNRDYMRTDDISRVRQGLDWWVGDFNSQFSYALDSQTDSNGNPTSSINLRPIDYQLTSHELRLVGDAVQSRLNWVFGGIYSKAENNWKQYEIYDGLSSAYSAFIPFAWASDYQAAAEDDPAKYGVIGSDTWFYTNRDEAITQRAFYGNVAFNVDERWEVSGGLRWFDVDINNDYVQAGYFGGTEVALASADYSAGVISEDELNAIIAANVASNYTTDATFEQQEDGTQFMLNTSYDFGDTLVYATIAEGYRIGGVNRSFPIRDGSFPVPQTFNSDSLLSKELGVKSRLLGGNLAIDAAIYDIDWEDIQFALMDPVTSFVFNTNAGQARVRGLEMSARWQVTDNLQVDANATFLDHKVESLTEDAKNRGIEAGDPLLGVSDERFAIGIKYLYDWQGWDGFVRLDYQYTGDYLNRYYEQGSSQVDIDTAQIDSYGLVDFTTGVSAEHWEFQLYVRNVFNSDDIISQDLSRVSFNGGTYADVTGDPGRVITLKPRTIGMVARYLFN